MSGMKNTVFVYGTLQQGASNHYLLSGSDAEFLGTALTADRYIMRARRSPGRMGIPFVGKSQAVSRIKGEVYAVSDAVLKKLDQLEGCHIEEPSRSWYHREIVEVHFKDRSAEEKASKAWVYFNDGSQESIVPSGEWNDKTVPIEGRPVWYFAYGSNQDAQRLTKRKVDFDQRSVGLLPGHVCVFNKRATNGNKAYANVMPKADMSSPLRGILYRTSETSLQALDRFEGAPDHYRQALMKVQLESTGNWVDAVVYVAQPDRIAADLPVDRAYRDHVAAGADLLGAPDTWTNTEWPKELV